MKTLLKRFAGITLIMSALWLPFYIGGHVLPDGWVGDDSLWWGFPMMLTLTFGAVGLLVLGVITAADV